LVLTWFSASSLLSDPQKIGGCGAEVFKNRISAGFLLLSPERQVFRPVSVRACPEMMKTGQQQAKK